MLPVDASAPLSLTFILPTRNRREWVGRAIESCLRADQPDVQVEVLVVDGNSTDGSFEELHQRYANDRRVRLVRQTGPKGFMPACFGAVPKVMTRFVTFMYDDDVLSPFWADMPRAMQRCRANFVLGFSAGANIERVVTFEPVTRLLIVTPSFLLRGFFGFGHQLSSSGLPFSPICCLTRTDWLREWMSEVGQFTHGRRIREYFMMQRNAGPDLMIYLLSISNHTGEIPLFDGPVAQCSAHTASLTSGFESTELAIGYWLAGVWLCGRLRGLRRHTDAGWCAAYVVRQGLRLVLKRLGRRQLAWLGPMMAEIAAVFFQTTLNPSAISFFKAFVVFVLPRRWRAQFSLSSRTESLLR